LGCSHKVNSKPCEDGSYCTVGDNCSKGKCAAGKAKNCDDGNVCTYNYCSNFSKACKLLNRSSSTKCSDKNLCTNDDKCDGKGTCKAGAATKCDDHNPCTLDICSSKTGKCGSTVSTKLCKTVTIPWTESFSYFDSSWSMHNGDNAIAWRTDGSGAPGKLAGTASLNFNNGKNYSNGKRVWGSAYGRFLVDATKLKGAITMAFFSYHGVESGSNSAKYDKRYIEFSTNGFASVAKTVLLDNKKFAKAWHMETINLSAFKGKTFQLRFRFDSVDSSANTGPGWFVDELNIYAGPVRTISVGGQFYEPFDSNNSNGWQFSAQYGANKSVWAIDKTPSTPGAYSGVSLNFNNGTNYSGGTTKGSALSPVINLEPLAAKAGNVTLWFKTWQQTETSPFYDKRWVEVSDNGFSSSSSAHLKKATLSNSNYYQYGWQWYSVDLSQFKGKKVRVRMQFDSVNSYKNTYKGWFIDDLYIDTKPLPSYANMITCNNKSSWTISKGNSSGANWNVDNTGIGYLSANCSLNFNAYSSAVKKYNYACPKGKNKVFGSATSWTIKVSKPTTAGAKTKLTFDAYMDVESISSYDYMRVYVRDILKKQEKYWVANKVNNLKKWSKHSIDLSTYHDRLITVRFYFDSKDCKNNTGKGVAIENVMIRADK
jgi:hypothetical protein